MERFIRQVIWWLILLLMLFSGLAIFLLPPFLMIGMLMS